LNTLLTAYCILPTTSFKRYLGTNDCANARGLGSLVEPGHAVDAVAVEQRHGRVPQVGRTFDERLGQRSRLQETEGGRGMQFDVGHGHLTRVS
jgi:hypothetical protein